jgi:hypothetical protein
LAGEVGVRKDRLHTQEGRIVSKEGRKEG